MKRTVLFLLGSVVAAVGISVKTPDVQACGTCQDQSGGIGQWCMPNWVSAYNCITYIGSPPTCEQTSSCLGSY
jgi:hypothetical protein